MSRAALDYVNEIAAADRLRGSALHLLRVLADHANADTGAAWPGDRLLMVELNVNARNLRKARAALMAADVIPIALGTGTTSTRYWFPVVHTPVCIDPPARGVDIDRAVDSDPVANDRAGGRYRPRGGSISTSKQDEQDEQELDAGARDLTLAQRRRLLDAGADDERLARVAARAAAELAAERPPRAPLVVMLPGTPAMRERARRLPR